MTLVDTAPQRIALMAWDSDTRFQSYTDLWTTTLDEVLRPAVLVDDGGGDFPAGAAGVEEPVERYTITVIAAKYGEGSVGEAERLARSLTASVVRYFIKRPQLQYSNLRGHPTLTKQPGLSGVQYIRLTRPVVRPFGGSEGEGPFWGCQGIVVSITEIVSSEEVVIRTPPTLT